MPRTWFSEIPHRWPGELNNPDLRSLRFRIAFEDVPNFRLLVGVVLLGEGVMSLLIILTYSVKEKIPCYKSLRG